MLTITSKDGSRRIVNLHPSFYLNPKTGEKISKGELVSKIEDLVSDTIKFTHLYEAILTIGQQKIVHIKHDHNKPGSISEPKIDEREALKDLKRDLEYTEFRIKLVPGKKGFDVVKLKPLKIAA